MKRMLSVIFVSTILMAMFAMPAQAVTVGTAQANVLKTQGEPNYWILDIYYYDLAESAFLGGGQSRMAFKLKDGSGGILGSFYNYDAIPVGAWPRPLIHRVAAEMWNVDLNDVASMKVYYDQTTDGGNEVLAFDFPVAGLFVDSPPTFNYPAGGGGGVPVASVVTGITQITEDTIATVTPIGLAAIAIGVIILSWHFGRKIFRTVAK